MGEITEIEGSPQGAGRRVVVVASRFNGEVVDRLVQGALGCLSEHGVSAEAIRVVRVPGAWELPLALQEVAAAGEVDALVALGVLIRGETGHFDHIATQASAAIARLGLEHRVPIGYGLLTCETAEQAWERAGGPAGDRGAEAALAALHMADLCSRLRSS